MLFELFALWVIKDTTEQISKRLEEEHGLDLSSNRCRRDECHGND